MGRIKTLLIKRLTNTIFEKFRDNISQDYSKNKDFLNTNIDIKSKKIRNIMAGYLTRLAKVKEI